MSVEKLIVDHMETWTSALQTRSTAGRGSSGKIDLYGIKKLRELILELAVRGKLVPQDPNDEPASELLRGMKKQQEDLIKERKIKKPKKLPSIDGTLESISVPQGWELCYLNDIGDWGAGATPNRTNSGYYGGDIPWFKSGELSEDYITDSEEHITALALKECSLRDNQPGDVLIAMYGATIGKTSILNTRSTTNQAVCACTPFDGLSNQYLLIFLKASKKVFTAMGAGGAQPNISKEKIVATLFALPPLNEQLRIVKKVEQLMSLCDQLEQQSLTSLDAHQQLVETLLGTLTDSQNAEELAENWARINEHFDTLFTTEASVDALKQTILQLAVMGKLVPQDPNDEPASELLKRIAQEKAQLVKEGKIKKQKPLPPISDEEKPFELPEGWCFCRMDDLCSAITSGSTPSKEIFSTDEGIPYLKVYNIRNQQIDFKYQPQFIQRQYHFEKMQRSILYPGDVIMNIVGPPLGKIAIIPDHYPEWNCNQAIVLFRLIKKDLNKYVYNYLLSGVFLDFIELIGTAGQDNISIAKSKNIVIPLAPVNEQNRIVEKLTEIINIAEKLKHKINITKQTQLHLADALTDAAIN
ncbi:restriction endonuclease subunit S [Escherichia fergusonii]|uniref:restriction endonuclease subunit S n=1 Tax=Escherichia fergusonii TaxID=564 RepID=UPI0015D772D2|nr:restriction endonuclease subunit S [Escherichia fergusonii]MBZ4075842.1 restriction endonuclease subunit S [Escherichia fergusonii]MBZ4106232.1 restriction endonuclease subunit S [Escherichia fergusonii]MBZ4113035.1 restriction endonuclease subunit S [Escherichia fergusonii]MBZ4120723.1 restriction endonuclease subunit S [Escherichia fergusonii]MBZ4125121.1 restriction endonuclease subunit S [Escherichia fergusonii]